MPSKFHVQNVFTVEGRGLVFQGTIVEGVVEKGMHIHLLRLDRSIRISEIEAIHSRGIPLGSVGLVSEGMAADLELIKASAVNQLIEIL